MASNPLQQLLDFGQSVWLDELRRDWLEDGRLRRFVEHDAIRGVTSNPSIFEKAIGGSRAYDEEMARLARAGLGSERIYDALTVSDIRRACDLFRPVYDATDTWDGYVSHEVSPRLAYDGAATVREAHRLWREVDRANLMIKIPATTEGMPAVQACLEDGLNINVTLLFSLEQYEAVAEAYVAALEARTAAGEPIARTASVASFFVSRVDTLVDRLLSAREEAANDEASRAEARALRGAAAVANARRAYRRFQELFDGPRFQRLAARGGRPQRVLWASTGTKDPAYGDVCYVEPLVGSRTVTTLPLETLEAYRDHGRPDATLARDLEEADRVVRRLADLDIDLDELGRRLLVEGVDKFSTALDGVLATVDRRRQDLLVL